MEQGWQFREWDEGKLVEASAFALDGEVAAFEVGLAAA
jgi:hypothetical protein